MAMRNFIALSSDLPEGKCGIGGQSQLRFSAAADEEGGGVVGVF